MNRFFTVVGPYLAIGLLITTGLSTYGCGDSASVSEDVQVPLSSLTASPGTLHPAFSPNTTNYQFNAPTAASSVTVTASPKDSTTTMTINGIPTAAGQERSVPLGPPGSTETIPIALSSQTGIESTYTVAVTRLLSSDNNLKTLTVTQGPLSPAFASDQLTYRVDVATDVTGVTVAATKSDPNSVISGDVPNEGQATIQLDGPGTSKVVSIAVTAPNGNSKTYRITVNRAASSNNNLSALTVTPSSMRPGFATSTLIYTVDVATDVRSVLVSATKDDPNAVLSGSIPDPGLGQAVGQATIPLDGPGTSRVVLITVTAQDATTSKTYRITVNRAASSNNNLSALNIAPGPLEPVFAANTLDYTVNVAHTISAVVISATKEDPNAVISGSVPNEGQATIPLDGPGTSRVVLITVTAQDATTSKTYRVTVNRAASNDSTLSALSVSAGSLEPGFAPGTVNYTVKVGLLIGSVTITLTKSDPNAVMSALGSVIAAAGTQTGQVTVSPGLGANPPINILVIAQDGVTSTTYTITVTRSF